MTIAEMVPPNIASSYIEDGLCEQLNQTDLGLKPFTERTYTTHISGAEVAWTHTTPKNLEDIVDYTPIIIENGLIGTDEAYRSFAEHLASRGYIVLRKPPPRHQRADLAWQPHNITHPMELQAKATWAIMRDYKQEFPIEYGAVRQKFHLVGHSMGGPVGADVAEHHPESIASVTLIGAAGLERHYTPIMAKRLGEFLFKELLPATAKPGRWVNVALGKASLQHILSAPLRTGREALQVSNHDTRPALSRLQQLGIPLYNIQPANDHFFPYCQQLDSRKLFNRFVKFNVGDANHLILQTQPGLTAAVVHNLITTSPSEWPLAA